MSELTREASIKQKIKKAQADFRGKINENPLAISCRFSEKEKKVVVNLANGDSHSFSPDMFPWLKDATTKQLSNVELFPSGSALYWPDLDADLSIPELMEKLKQG